MRLSLALRSSVPAVLAVLFALTTLSAQESTEKNQTVPPPTVVEGRMVTVEFQLIDLPTEALEVNGQGGEVTAAHVSELLKANKALAVSRLKLSATDGMTSEVQFGERVSTAVGRTSGPRGGTAGFGEQVNYQFENLGFMASVAPKIMPDQSIALAVTFERSRIAPTRTPASPPTPAGPPTPPASPSTFTPPPKHDQIRVKLNVVVKPNVPVLLASRSTGPDQGVTTVVLVSSSAP